MALGKMRSFAASSPANAGTYFFAANLGSFRIVSLKHNNGGTNSVYNNHYFNAKFNPAIAIIIVVLFSILFFMGVFSIYIRRCIMDDDGTRSSSRAGGEDNNVEANSGLERTVIESFPVFSYNLVKGLKVQAKGSECAVCLTDFEDEEMLRLLPMCRHAFHPECIDMWLCSHATCPVCRTSLLPAGEPNLPNTEFGFVEPEEPPEQLTIVVNNGGSAVISRHGSVDIFNDGATNVATEAGHDSMGHSLVRVRKELQQPAEWYIATAEGMTPGLHRSCSFVAMHHSQGPSSYKGATAGSYKAGGFMGDAACRATSERWGSISVNPASFLRTFSDRFAPQPAESKRFNSRSTGII